MFKEDETDIKKIQILKETDTKKLMDGLGTKFKEYSSKMKEVSNSIPTDETGDGSILKESRKAFK
jgi:hypothetical protein